MAHPPRQYHEGYWYHVYARSLEEVSLFELDDEREWFIHKMDRVFSRRKVSVGAVCLMESHYHALVRMGSVSLDRALNGLHMSYTKWINNQRNRGGPLFRSRPGADIVLDDAYLLQLVSYIHQNPVKAEVVSSPEEYTWSTDSVYRGTVSDRWNFESWRFPPHFKDAEERVKVYKERMGESVDKPAGGEGWIGKQEDWNQLDKRAEQRDGRHRDRRGRKSMDTIAQKRLKKEDALKIDDLKQPGRSQPEARIRQQIMVEMYKEGYGPGEIGDYFNRDKSAVNYAVREYG